MDLACPQCGLRFSTAGVDSPIAAVQCPQCSATFAARIGRLSDPALAGPRPVVEKPAHVACEETPQGVKIWWNWLHWELLLILLFWIIWSAFFLLMGLALGVMAFAAQAGNPWFLVIWGIFVLVGLGVSLSLGFHLLVGLLNTTTIELSGDDLRVRHGPLSWTSPIELQASRVKQLYGVIKVYPMGLTFRLHRHPDTFDLVALLDDGSKTTLLAGQFDAKVVRFIEQQLEKRMKIEDQRLPDEYLY